MTSAHILTLVILTFKCGGLLSAPAKDYEDASVELHDQRQNGTENYRLDMKDVFIVLSPLDSMFSIAGVASEAGILKPPPQTGSDLSHLTFLADLKHLDNNSPEIESGSYQQNKPAKKWSNSKIGSFIKMFVDRRRLGNLGGTY